MSSKKAEEKYSSALFLVALVHVGGVQINENVLRYLVVKLEEKRSNVKPRAARPAAPAVEAPAVEAAE